MGEGPPPSRENRRGRGRVLVAIAVVAGVAIGIGIRVVRQQAEAPQAQDDAGFALVEPMITEYLQRPVRAAGDRLPQDLSPPRCALTYLGGSELTADTTRWFVVYRCAQYRREPGGDLSVERAWGGPLAVDVHIGERGPGIVQVQEPGEGSAELAALFPEDIAARIATEGVQLDPSETILRERAQAWFDARSRADET